MPEGRPKMAPLLGLKKERYAHPFLNPDICFFTGFIVFCTAPASAFTKNYRRADLYQWRPPYQKDGILRNQGDIDMELPVRKIVRRWFEGTHQSSNEIEIVR